MKGLIILKKTQAFKFETDKTPSPRVKKWFSGKMNGMPIEFKFTYLADIEKQVKIKIGSKVHTVSLNEFKATIVPDRKDEVFKLA